MAEDEKLKQIPIYYERSRHYRTIHVDGAQAGLTPRAGIQFMFFVETKPTPEYVLHKLSDEGGLGEEIERVEKKGVIREAQVNIVMDEATTTQFIDLLQRVLKQLESLRQPEEVEARLEAVQGTPEASKLK